MQMRSSFDSGPTRKKLENQKRGVQQSIPVLMRRAGLQISASAAFSTVPYGNGEQSRLLGEVATRRDIRKCYATPGDVFAAFPEKKWARAFWAEIQSGNFVRAQKIMQEHCPRFHNKDIRAFDDGAAHRANRNHRGRVSKSQEPVFVVQTMRNVLAYIKQELDRVGFGKAGWAACAKALGGIRGIGQWITKHKAPGAVLENYTGEIATVSLTNKVDYADQILDDTEKQQAVDIALAKLGRAILIEERKLAQANGFA